MTETQSGKRRWPRKTLLSLVTFAIVFHLGGGWYFSNLIRTDALEPGPSERDYGVQVVEVSESSIVIDGTDRRAIGHPGTLGLWWESGYGQVGDIQSFEGTAVTRDFTVLDGDFPPVCAPDDQGNCTEVDLQGYAFPSDPSDVGLAFEEVVYESPVGTMGAWLIPPAFEPSNVWAIHMHGRRAERRETVRMLPAYAAAGITSLVIDYRNDAGVPEDPSGLYKYGRTEWNDAEAAVQFALDAGAEGVVLVGYSTGAAAEMAFLERSSLAESVTGIVFDSPNIDFGRVVSEEAAKRTIPGTPIPLPGSLVGAAKWIADLRFDIDWEAINYVGRDGIIDVPTLVFHGENDQTVPVSVSRDLEAQYPNLVTLVSLAEADHVQTWNVDPGQYEQVLVEFLDQVVHGA